MKIKVLFVTNDSVTYGSTRSMLNLIDELTKKDVQISVLIPTRGPLEEELRKRDVEYKIGNYYTGVIPKGQKGKVKFYIKTVLNYFIAIPIARWAKKNKFTIIHSVNSAVFMGEYIRKINHTLHIWHIRELMQEDHNLEFFNTKMAYSMFNKADYRIYVSKCVENKYEKILTKKNSKVIYNGIPTDNYVDASMPKLTNKFRLLIAGNICKTKGQQDAIKATEYLINKGVDNIELDIAGDGYMQEELEKYVKDKGIEQSIRFLGFRNDLNSIRKNINIYLMCSRNEAFGRVTVESMLSKNLVIRSKYRWDYRINTE